MDYKNAEKAADEKIARLEAEVAKGQKALAQKFTVDALRELDKKSAELDDLRQRRKREKQVKEEYRKRYANTFATAEDFDRLWATRLRDDAMVEEANRADMPLDTTHSLYQLR
jgi:hypothetical protein